MIQPITLDLAHKLINEQFSEYAHLPIGNMLFKDGKLSAIIDFGGIGLGDPACDLVIACTLLKNKARDLFIREIALDEDMWLHAKATFELCQIADKNSSEASVKKAIIEDVLRES